MARPISSADLSVAKLETDVLIVGAGPLGITASIGLSERGIDHIIAESGEEWVGDAQDLCGGNLIGGRYPDLDETRIRALGGTTHIWGGHCAPFRKIDFEARPWLGSKGWPIDFEEYRKWFSAVAPLFRIKDSWRAADIEGTPASLANRRFHLFDLEAFRLSPTVDYKTGSRENFWSFNHKRSHGKTITDLTARALNFSSDGTIKSIRFQRPDASQIDISAKKIVLAMGGIETARFLLVNKLRSPASPLADLPLIGTGFMEHAHPHMADLFLFEPLAKQFFALEQKDRSFGNIVFFLKPEVQKRLELPSFYVRPEFHSGSVLSWFDRRAMVQIVGLFEQLPSNKRFVSLSTTEFDRLGDPLVELAYHANHFDHKTINTGVDLIAEELAMSGFGRVRVRMRQPREDEAVEDLPWVGVGHHHMGTVRMGWSRQDGVVDKNLKVFGTKNLYLATTGVFPTSSCVNPTMNGAALAMRLASHLSEMPK